MTISIRWILAAAVPTALGLSGIACADQGADDALDSGVENDAGAASTVEAGTSAETDASDASDAASIELCSADGWCPVSPPRPGAAYSVATATKSGLYAVFATTAGTRLGSWTSDNGWTAISQSMPLAASPHYVAFDSAAVMDDDGDQGVLIAGSDGNSGVAGYYGIPPHDPTQEWALTAFSLNCGWPTMSYGTVTRLANIGGEVYLAACAGLYRFDRLACSSGAADCFEPVYVDENASTDSAPAMVFSVAGTASDDLWLAAYRTQSFTDCLRLVHIAPGGATAIADSDPTSTGCVANGKGMVDPVLGDSNVARRSGIAPAKGVYVMPELLPEPNRLLRWTLGTGMDDVTVEYSTAKNPWPNAITGLWQGKSRIWAVAGTFILQVDNPWDPSSTFQLSTQSRNGFVDGKSLTIVTGTPDALWLLSTDGIALRRQEK